MAELFTRTEIVDEKRIQDDPNEGVRRIAAALLIKNATVDDLGTEETAKVRLRTTDNPAAMIAAVRAASAKMAKFAVVQAAKGKETTTGEGKIDPIEVTEANLAAGTRQKHELSPEEAEATLGTLEARFTAPENLKLHEGVSWNRVRVALEANPEALWSINKMQAAGHDPDVYDADDEGFDIGTCSKESPVSGRNCVYTKVKMVFGT